MHPRVMRTQVCSNEGPQFFSRGDNYKIEKIHWQNLKIFSKTIGPISTTLGQKEPLVKGIQVYSNEGSHPFPRGDKYEIVKIHWLNLKIFFSRTTWPFSTKLGTMHPRVKGIQVCLNEGPSFFQGDIIGNTEYTLTNLKYLLLQNHWPNFNQTWHKASLGEGDSSLFKWRAPPFPKGR